MMFLVKDRPVFVDDEDWPRIKDYRWTWGAGKAGKGRYVIARDGEDIVSLHRVLTNASTGTVVDHKNRDTADNRQDNLRVTTHQVNNINRGRNRNNTSGVKGVSWMRQRNKWRAYVTVDRKQIALGLFDSFAEAVAARQEGERQYFPADALVPPPSGVRSIAA